MSCSCVDCCSFAFFVAYIFVCFVYMCCLCLLAVVGRGWLFCACVLCLFVVVFCLVVVEYYHIVQTSRRAQVVAKPIENIQLCLFVCVFSFFVFFVCCRF